MTPIINPAGPIVDGINAWLQGAASGALPLGLRAVGTFLFQTPDFGAISGIRSLGRLALEASDAILTLGLLGCGVLLMASGTISQRYSAKQILPRLLFGAVMANASPAITSYLTQFNNALVRALVGADPLTTGWGAVTSNVQAATAGGPIVAALVAIVAVVLCLFLVVVYLGRDLVLVVLTVGAPLALMTYGLPRVGEIAGLWWRGFTAALFLQVAHTLLVAVAAGLLANPGWLGLPEQQAWAPVNGLIDALAFVALLYVMVKIPFVAYRWAFGHRISENPAVQRTVTLVKTGAKVAMALA
jgi:hypothetical protein